MHRNDENGLFHMRRSGAEFRDEMNYMRSRWRCPTCDGLSSLEVDNVCRHCAYQQETSK